MPRRALEFASRMIGGAFFGHERWCEGRPTASSTFCYGTMFATTAHLARANRNFQTNPKPTTSMVLNSSFAVVCPVTVGEPCAVREIAEIVSNISLVMKHRGCNIAASVDGDVEADHIRNQNVSGREVEYTRWRGGFASFIAVAHLLGDGTWSTNGPV